MSALGQKQTIEARLSDVRFAPKSGHWSELSDVRFVPIADIHLAKLVGQILHC